MQHAPTASKQWNGQDSASEAEKCWLRVQGRLRAHFGEATFKSWFKPLGIAGVRGGQVMITVPTRFMREWVMTHYAEDLFQFWKLEDASVESVDIFVRPNSFSPAAALPAANADMAAPAETLYHNRQSTDAKNLATKPKAVQAQSRPVNDDEQGAHCMVGLDSRFTFDSFIVGKPNELAHAASRRVAESDGVVPGCNPLFIYGGVGLGKTHLMHAIAWHIRQFTPQRRVMYLTAEQFMYEFIRALRDRNTVSFKERFRSVDVLMVDDVQFISGKDSTQEEFFHTFNALVDQNKQIIISGDRSPSDLEGMEERVRSRLGWGLVADVHSTTYELRMGILQSKLEVLGMEVPPAVLEFLASKITSNVRELEGALNRVVAHSSLVGRDITLETTQSVLKDLLRANEKRVSVEDIQKKVADHFHIKVSDMHSARRSRTVARPRQVAMFLSKRLTTHSLPEIGRKFGGKDHTTVMHAVKRIEALLQEDKTLAEDVDLLTRMLDG